MKIRSFAIFFSKLAGFSWFLSTTSAFLGLAVTLFEEVGIDSGRYYPSLQISLVGDCEYTVYTALCASLLFFGSSMVGQWAIKDLDPDTPDLIRAIVEPSIRICALTVFLVAGSLIFQYPYYFSELFRPRSPYMYSLSEIRIITTFVRILLHIAAGLLLLNRQTFIVEWVTRLSQQSQPSTAVESWPPAPK
jgi:hypothetical protein